MEGKEHNFNLLLRSIQWSILEVDSGCDFVRVELFLKSYQIYNLHSSLQMEET
jgi:hypothetical protein